MKQFKDFKKNKTLSWMVKYLVEEDFPCEHLDALADIISMFNDNEIAEKEVFEFSKQLFAKHSFKCYKNIETPPF